MGVPDIRKFKHFCRLRPVSAVGNAIDDCLKRNFGKRKRRRSSDERAREDAEMAAARHLKYGFERKRTATAEKADQAGVTATTQKRKRVEDRGIADNIEDGIDPVRMAFANPLGQLRQLQIQFLRP